MWMLIPSLRKRLLPKTQISVEVRTSEDPMRVAARIQARWELYKKRIKEVGDPIARETRDIMREYPPERPKQKYVRTFTLRKGWSWRSWAITNGRTYSVFNRVPYSPYVQGALQAWMHIDRWTVLDVQIGKMRKEMYRQLVELRRRFIRGE